jgi:copper chaperone CopZ
MRFASVILALLSSSCCILQLILNSLSIGCAGFSLLDAYRTELTVLTLTLMAYNLIYHRLKYTVYTTVICVVLMLSPEALSTLNSYRTRPTVKASDCIQLEYSVPSMKCEGCANRIKSELQNNAMVAQVLFKSKTLIVTSRTAKHAVVSEVLDKLGHEYILRAKRTDQEC